MCTSNDQVAEFEDYCIETESEHSLFIAKIYAQLYVDFKQGKSPLWTVLSHMCRVKNNDPSFPENEEWALNELKKIFPPEFSEKCLFLSFLRFFDCLKKMSQKRCFGG